MIVCVQKGMDALKKRLEKSGHKVVYQGEYTHGVDAYVYNGHGTHIGLTSMYQHSPLSSSIFGVGANPVSDTANYNGGIEIYASGKSIDEIEALLIKSRRVDYF